MIDLKLLTFLSLCEEMNYTKTAKKLHITQPAVTQHIQFLERYYGEKLFVYENRKLKLTKAGEILYNFSISLKSSSDKIKEVIASNNFTSKNIKFGATLTIGEYLMPEIISTLYRKNNNLNISMEVANTKHLLKYLERGDIDFALIEGHFDKLKYESFLFSKEDFILVGAIDMEIDSFEDLISNNIIVREKGSGTREILEQILYEENLSLENFNRITEIGNMNVIKYLIEKKCGISFLYKRAVEKELDAGILKEIKLKDFEFKREFNFVFLKNNYYYEEYKKIYDVFKKIKEGI